MGMAGNVATKILIVDPCSLTRECVGMILKARRFDVRTAPNMKSARDLIHEFRPNIIIHELDIQGADPATLTRFARATIAEHPVEFLLLTSSKDKALILNAIEQGITQIMMKGEFTIRIFLSKIDQLLNALTDPARVIAHAKSVATPGEPSQTQTQSQPQTQTTSTTAEPKPVPTGSVQAFNHERAQSTLKAIKPAHDKNAVLERVDEISNLKALSPTTSRVLAMTRSKESSLDAITKEIRNDHAIALKIIKIANSSAFARGEPVTTLKDAVRRIGLAQIQQAVLNIEVMDSFTADLDGLVDHRLFWEHSIAVATCAAMLAREVPGADADNAFTLGILHDIGKMILVEAFPDEYTQILTTAHNEMLPLELVERRVLCIDHASVLAPVLLKWGMGASLIDPIVNHHLSVGNMRQTAPKSLEPACLIALADRIVHAIGIGCAGNPTLYPTEEYFEALKLPTAILPRIADKLPEHVLDLRFTLLGSMGNESFPQISNPIHDNGINPRYVSLDTNSDALKYRFISTLHTPDNPPDLIVARLRDARESVRIDSMIKKIESEEGVENLPVIVLSNSGKLTLPEISCTKRPVRTLPLPFSVRLLDSVIKELKKPEDAAEPETQEHNAAA